MGEKSQGALKLQFDKRLRLEFHGARITSDAGLLAWRELDEALGLTEAAPNYLRETRGGRNVQHELVPLLVSTPGMYKGNLYKRAEEFFRFPQ
jgi:hypothetical protein